ncbi:MAG: cysteine dioxygenase family protein [Bryobacteraceae bacterium]
MAAVATDSLQAQVDAAVRLGDPKAIVERIREDLSLAIRDGSLRLPDVVRQTFPDRYGRRLIFSNPELDYTAVAMTWGPGQGTAIHDHAGIWCVEGVVEGEMEVTQFELEEERDHLCRFQRKQSIQARVGSAGWLIPPYEHHVLANATALVAVTLHIYGGEMNQCDIFVPRADGWCERQSRTLAYDN